MATLDTKGRKSIAALSMTDYARYLIASVFVGFLSVSLLYGAQHLGEE